MRTRRREKEGSPKIEEEAMDHRALDSPVENSVRMPTNPPPLSRYAAVCSRLQSAVGEE